jgi:type IV pilus biogenesis protein CpaD/CtpE
MPGVFHVPVVVPDPWRPFMRVPVVSIFLVAGIGVIIGCSSIQPSLSAKIPDPYRSLTACQKTDLMWNDKIIPTMASSYGDEKLNFQDNMEK